MSEFASNTKIKIDACVDHTRPALAIEIDKMGKSFADIKTKGTRVRVLTEITTDNISYCKRLSALVHELRHLDGIKGSFYLFHRQEKLGVINLLIEAAKRRDVKARILTPKNVLIDKTVQMLKKQPEHRKIDIRYIPEHLQTQVTFLVVDRKSSLVVEIKDDSKKSSYEAMGLGTYSNSQSTVSSFVSIFETLWRQTEMYAEDELDNMKHYLMLIRNRNDSLKQFAHFPIKD